MFFPPHLVLKPVVAGFVLRPPRKQRESGNEKLITTAREHEDAVVRNSPNDAVLLIFGASKSIKNFPPL